MLVPPIVRSDPEGRPDADAIAHVYIEAWRSARRYGTQRRPGPHVRWSAGERMAAATLAAEANEPVCSSPICPATALSVSAAAVGPPHVFVCLARFTRFTSRRSTMIAAWGARYS